MIIKKMRKKTTKTEAANRLVWSNSHPAKHEEISGLLIRCGPAWGDQPLTVILTIEIFSNSM